jgi:hypothetical protein
VRSIRNRPTGRRLAVAVLALATILAGCTGDADDPRSAVGSAATDLRDQEGTELRIRATDGLAELGATADPDLVELANGADLVLRSSRERAVHAQLEVDDEPEAVAALDAVASRLTTVGLERIAVLLTAGDWLRVTNPPEDGSPDPLGDALGAALERLAEDADDAEEVEDPDPERVVRLTAGRELVDDVARAVVLAADTDDAPPPGEGGGTGVTTVEVHLADDRISEVRLPVEVGGADVQVSIVVSEPADPHDLPTDAQPFGLRALVRDLAVTTPSGEAPDDGDPAGTPGSDEPAGAPGSDDDSSPGEDTDGEATPFREGGVLEEAFDGEDPFADTDFECITEAELEQLETTLGADGRAEVEELIALGHLERC